MLPYMSDKSIMRPAVRTQFGGLNHNKSARDWEIYWMTNGSSREFPLIAPRKGRILSYTVPNAATDNPVTGLGTWDNHLFYTSAGGFFYRDRLTFDRKGAVDANEKSFAFMGSMILIFPDKKYYDTASDTFGKLETSQSFSGVSFQNGTYAGVPANANTIYKSGAAWEFRPGDAITIEGSDFNDGTYIVREVNGDYLRFYEGTFNLPFSLDYTAEESVEAGDYYVTITWNGITSTGVFTLPAMSEGDTLHLDLEHPYITATIGGVVSQIVVSEGSPEGRLPIPFTTTYIDYTDPNTITIAREVPDLDFVCVNENRLWGCKGDTIYASALGDPFNFNVFDGLSTDSWQSAVPDEGDFTACVSYGGYPIFFKENSICKVQGDKPSNFQWTISSRFGVKEGCAGSLAVAGDTLFYMSPVGVCAYNGGAPRVISAPLGANKKWVKAYGGTDGIQYYTSVRDDVSSSAQLDLFVFDTRYGEWFREDNSYGLFTKDNYNLYHLNVLNGKMYKLDYPENNYSDERVYWRIEFADNYRFYETQDTASQNKKGPLRLLIRAELAEDAEIHVSVSYDDEGFSASSIIGTLWGSEGMKKKTYVLPMILRRNDHYKLMLEGNGDAVIYSITVEQYSGSQFQGSSNVTLPNQDY